KNFNLVHHAASQRSFVQCDRINSHCGRAIPPVFLCKNAVTQQPGYPVSLVSALLNQALLKTHGAKIRLERFNLAARDRPNIAIRSHEPPNHRRSDRKRRASSHHYRLALPAARGEDLKSFRVLVIDEHPLLPTAGTVRGALDRLSQRLVKSGAKAARESLLVPDLAHSARVYMRPSCYPCSPHSGHPISIVRHTAGRRHSSQTTIAWWRSAPAARSSATATGWPPMVRAPESSNSGARCSVIGTSCSVRPCQLWPFLTIIPCQSVPARSRSTARTARTLISWCGRELRPWRGSPRQPRRLIGRKPAWRPDPRNLS